MTARAPKMLVVTRNLPPLLGGMERLNWHIVEQLSYLGDVDVVAPSESKLPGSDRVHLHGVSGRPLWKFLTTSTAHNLYVALQRRPSIILAGSGLTAPAAWLAARATGALAAAYLHGLDISVDHSVYRRLWLPVLRRMDLVLVNSTATYALAREAGIATERLHMILPGVKLPESIAPAPSEVATFRERFGLGNGPLLLSVGRLTRRKGLVQFVSDVLPAILEQHPQAKLIIAGAAAGDALNPSSVLPEEVLAAAPEHAKTSIHFLGVVSDEILASAYQASAVHVFPVQAIPGDPEGFGMVAIEAAAHGLATVAYATGGVTDAVRDTISGYLAPAGEHAALTLRILQVIEQPLPRAPMLEFAREFSWSIFGTKVRLAFNAATGNRP